MLETYHTQKQHNVSNVTKVLLEKMLLLHRINLKEQEVHQTLRAKPADENKSSKRYKIKKKKQPDSTEGIVTPCTDNSTCTNSLQSGKCKSLNLHTINCCSLRSTSKQALLAASTFSSYDITKQYRHRYGVQKPSK